MHLVSHGTPEELELFVSDPADFIANRTHPVQKATAGHIGGHMSAIHALVQDIHRGGGAGRDADVAEAPRRGEGLLQRQRAGLDQQEKAIARNRASPIQRHPQVATASFRSKAVKRAQTAEDQEAAMKEMIEALEAEARIQQHTRRAATQRAPHA